MNEQLSYDDLLHIAQNGLQAVTSRKKIIVVGAGMAGLSAAYLLEQAGHNVVMLEASNRVGGRVYTYRDEKGWNVELGAMRIPPHHKILWHYIKNVFRLNYKEFASSEPEAYVYVNGNRRKYKDYVRDPDSLGYNLPAEERGQTANQLLDAALKPYIDEYNSNGFDSIHPKYADMSLLEVLVTKTNLSKGAIEYISTLLNFGGLMKFSFSECLASYLYYDKVHQLTDDMDTLPKAFLNKMTNTEVHFNCQVTKITQKSSEVTVQCHCDSAERQATMMTADYVIITASAPAVSLIEFQPQLSIEKRLGLKNSFHDHTSKISLAFSKRFWEHEGIFGGHTITDLPSRILYYFTSRTNFTGGVITSYTYGDDAKLFEGLSDSECLREVLDNIATIHGEHVRQYYMGGFVKHWSLDRLAFGAYSVRVPYQSLFCSPDIMRKNHGRVWFAGEYTDLPAGWMETAVKSGIRVAHNVNKIDDSDVSFTANVTGLHRIAGSQSETS